MSEDFNKIGTRPTEGLQMYIPSYVSAILTFQDTMFTELFAFYGAMFAF